MDSPRLLAAALAVPLLLLTSRPLFPQGAEETAPPPRDDAYRPLGPELFPFYQHYLRTADRTEIRNVLYLYSSSDNPNGSWSRLLAPLFYRDIDTQPEARRLFLFPLLYFGKRSNEESYDYSVPFFFRRSTPSTSFQLLFPFWLRHEADQVAQTHFLFPLFRHTSDASNAAAPVTRARTGLWKLLELWESRSEPGVTDYRALNLLNWKEETRSGLPLLFYYSWARNGDSEDGKTYLFPFYWHGKLASSEYRWWVPFYGSSSAPGESDHFLLPLLSRFGTSAGGDLRLDVLFPLFHYNRSQKGASVASFPLFGYDRNEKGASWNVLFWPYRTTHHFDTGKRTHSFFYPLSSFDVEPDGTRGSRWVFPYIETFNTERLWRFVVPLYYEYQRLAGGESDWSFRTGLPLYWSWGYSEDNFAMGIPLYWASQNGPRGWDLFLPFYLDTYSASSSSHHVFPLVSWRTTPSRDQLFVLGPGYIHESFRGLDGHPSGSGNHFLWPLLGFENREDGHLVRVLPFFSTSREGDARDLLITPFYYQSQGPTGTHRYFIPFYGRHESGRTTHDFYAAASYIKTRERTETGTISRERDNFLWGLAAFESDHASGSSHDHVLPLLYWNTRSVPADYTVLGPLYYGHRIADAGEDHHLDLVLGNLFLSKVIEGPARIPEAAPDAAAGDRTQEGARVGVPTRERLWSDQGVLWPLSRWYRDSSGVEGRWLLPFYVDVKDNLSSNLAIFPFYFQQHEETPYNPSYFRYFYLFDRESWKGGHRMSLAQILLDWKAEESLDKYRLRVLYPLFEQESEHENYSFQLTPLFRLSRKDGVRNNWLFPFYWQGDTERRTASGELRHENSHFFLFPLYGYQSKATRRDHYALFPLIHLQTSEDAFRFELWPFYFHRDEPGLWASRIWPLHAEEHGVTAGDFWVSRWLFPSKHFVNGETSEYRLDPFLFRTSSGPDQFGMGGLFELFAYDRKGEDSSFRAIPLVFGYTKGEKSALGAIPLYFAKDFGREEIDYLTPWRFLFLSHHLTGASGERHTGVLWKLFEHTSNPNRPEYQELGFLYRFFFRRTTESSSQLQINPLYSYFRDETTDETRHSYLFALYSYHRLAGKVDHTLFYFFHF